jgi:glycine/D-amino acid oxidase-like deaminating enzyme
MAEGLIVAAGHGSLGVILAGGTARVLAAIMFDEPLPFDAEPFDPSRFVRNMGT